MVKKDDQIDVELLNTDKKTISFEPLLVFDDKDVKIGQPTVDGVKVTAEIIEAEKQADKVTSIRYKAKKRVKKVRGHRQKYATIKISSIS